MTVDTIIAKLSEVFIPMDEKVLEESQKWAKDRVAAIKAFKESDEAKIIRKAVDGVWAYYERLHNLAGGKTWYRVFDGRNAQMIEEIMIKNCANIANKRNETIRKKLVKANVTEIIDAVFTYTNDGFNGVFIVNTDKGKKRVSIDTIYAGGYNIQCLHLRVLVNVK